MSETMTISFKIPAEELTPTASALMKQWKEDLRSTSLISPSDYVDYRRLPRWYPVWYRPKMPNKRYGRKGTRKGWKRKNPPRQLYIDLHASVLCLSSPFLYPAYDKEGKIDRRVYDDYRTQFTMPY